MIKNERIKAIYEGKDFYLDYIKYIFPCQISRKLDHWGELEDLKGKRFNLLEINEIISDLIKSQPHIKGSMNLHLVFMRKGAYHHILDIKNYFYELEEADTELKLVKRL